MDETGKLHSCWKCNKTKPASEFYRDKARSTGITSACKVCHQRDMQKRRELNKKSYSGPTVLSKKCNGCKKILGADKFRARPEHPDGLACRCKDCYRSQSRAERIEALKIYGGDPPHCACCGEAKFEFLAIDHIEGGGHKHRKIGGGSVIYRWLRANNYPLGFRVLCHNCNQAIGYYGYCPHDDESGNN